MNWYKRSENQEFQFQETTGIPFYDDTLSKDPVTFFDLNENKAKTVPKSEYLKQQKKMTSEIVQMSPDEYLNLCANGAWQTYSSDEDFSFFKEQYLNVRRQNTDTLEKYRDLWKNQNSNPPMVFIVYRKGKFVDQEGIHRALVAKQLGVKKIPVLVVNQN